MLLVVNLVLVAMLTSSDTKIENVETLSTTTTTTTTTKRQKEEGLAYPPVHFAIHADG